MFKAKILKTVKNTKTWFIAMLAAIMFCVAAISVVTFLPNNLTSAKAEAPEVTDSKNGTVSLGELCERHDVLYAAVPGSYLNDDGNLNDTDPSLKALQAAGKLVVYNISSVLNIEGTTIKGWDSSFKASTHIKVMLVIPKEITDINAGTYTVTLSSQQYILTGVAFEEGSEMKKIPDKAFFDFSNLRFCILPPSVKTIGKLAFFSPQLIDMVMPAVEEIQSGAFAGATNLYHLTIPSTMKTIASDAFRGSFGNDHGNQLYEAVSLCDIENNSDNIKASDYFKCAMNIYGSSSQNTAGGKSYLHVWENYGTAHTPDSPTKEPESLKDREVNNSLVFSYNNLRSGTLANTTGGDKIYEKKWYFVTLDGVEDKALDFDWKQSTEYHFPEEINLAATRKKIKWDYLDSAGVKHINEFSGDTSVNEYDVGASACTNKVISRIFLPNSVKVVGNYAFLSSQVQVVDIPSSVTHIGKSAFRGAHRAPSSTNGHIYIRHQNITDLKVGSYAFTIGTIWNGIFPEGGPDNNPDKARKFIFSSKAAYESESNLAGKFNSANEGGITYTYLIPINTVVGETKETVDYRLYGQNYNFTKNDDATWTQKSNVPLPVLDGYTQTVWYQESGDIANPTASKVADISYINGKLNSKVSEINLYTKELAVPEFENQDYTYQKDENSTEDKGIEYTPARALNFTESNSADYAAEIVRFVDFNGDPVTPTPTSVENAGTYTIKVVPNAKWGTWDDTHNHTYTVNMARAEIDLGNYRNLPEFITDAGSLGGTERGTTIYEYGDGYYLYTKSGDISDPRTYTVTNSYARYTGSEIEIKTPSDFNLYKVIPVSNTVKTNSERSLAGFTFEVPNTNYVFVNKTFSENQEEFEKRGISYNSNAQNSTSVNVTKIWYIVKQQNWLIDSTAEEGSEEQYSLLTLNGESVSSLVYESEFGAGKYEVHIPKVAKGTTESGVTFTMTYGSTNAPITVDAGGALQPKAVSDLPEYINAAMPAGSYTIRINAGEATESNGSKLPEISETIRLTVLPGTINSVSVLSMLTGNTFEHAYDNGNLFLYDDATAATLESQLTAVNNTLNSVRKNLASDTDNIWKDSRYNAYYDNITIRYNLDRMQTSAYYNDLSAWTNHTQVPRNVGQYIVYYSLSALNYNTVGGANAADRRNYVFNTIIYRELSTAELGNIDKELVYNGSERYPSVPYSQYYTHAFPDENYINARENAKITFTITDTVLYRWSTENVPENVAIEQGVATVTYKIAPATNSWRVTPQMPSWTFNGFNTSVNAISSLLTFSDTTVTYRIKNSNGGYIGANGKPVDETNTAYLELIAEGNNITPADYAAFAAVLNLLKPGTYYLASSVAAYENGNVAAFDTLEAQYAQLIIGKANNRWTETPNVVRWTWGEYNKTRNEITAESLYPMDINGEAFDYGDTADVVYSVLDSKKNPIIGLSNFTVTDGIVEDTVAAVLETLPAGRYYLRTSLTGTDYYSDIYETDLRFDIVQAVNTWTTTPNAIRWTWGSYDRTTNRITAVAKYSSVQEGYEEEGKESAPEVKFTVLDSNFDLVDGLANFTATNGVVSEEIAALLAELTKGTYYLVASIEGRHNYSAINEGAIVRNGAEYDFADADYNETLQYVTFDVSEATNTWETTPGMTNWQYKRFDAGTNFVAGDPVYPTEDAVVKYGIFTSRPTEPASMAAFTGGLYMFTAITDVKTELENLAAGSYWFAAYVEGENGCYTPLFLTAQFSVIRSATNMWNPEPNITGWTYGEYDASLVTEGKAEFGTVKYTVQVQSKNNANVYNDVEDYIGLSYTDLVGKFDEEGNELAAGKLKTLGAGNYKLVAFTVAPEEETDNYNQATKELFFTVAKADNKWVDGKVPSIVGWTYGDEPNSYTAGETAYESGDITYTYYKARQINGVWIADITDGVDSSVEMTNKTPAGTYALVVVAEASANYNELTHTAIFTIAPYENGWDVMPEGTLDWTWGNADSAVDNSNLVKAAAKKYQETDPSYRITSTDGGKVDITTDKAGIKEALKGLDAGRYSVVTEFAKTDDYSALTTTTYITVAKANFEITAAPQNSSWTWGSSDKSFTEPTVDVVACDVGVDGTVKDGVYTVTYEVRVKNETAVSTYHTYGELTDDLFGRPAGEYVVDITVDGKNYNQVKWTVSVNVNKATFVWNTENDAVAENSEWFWNDKSADGKSVTEPKAHAVINGADVPVVFKYTVRKNSEAATTEYTDFESLRTALFKADVAIYTVTVTAVSVADNSAEPAVTYALSNFEWTDVTFTVTVKQAQNSWVDGDPRTEYNKVFVSDDLYPEAFVAPVPNFGEVQYFEKSGNSLLAITDNDIVTWLKKDDTGKYVFVMKVEGNDNYTGLEVEVTLNVTGLISHWDEESSLQENYDDLVWGSSLSEQMKDVAIPVPKYQPDDDINSDTILVYTIDYTDFDGVAGETITRRSQQDVIDYLTKTATLGAGNYTIKANYKPTNTNYSPLEYTVTIKVNKATVVWSDETLAIDPEYFNPYEGVEMPTPVAKYDDVEVAVKFTVTPKGGESYIYEGKDLQAHLNILDAGDYTVQYEVEGTNNYNGLPSETVHVVIGEASNFWTDENKTTQINLKNSWEFKRGEKFNVEFPYANRGTVYCIVKGDSIASSRIYDGVSLNDWLNNDNDLPAGTYNISFTVDAPESKNYNGLNHNATITVVKNEIDWATRPDATYDWSGDGTVDTSKFEMPTVSGTTGVTSNSLLIRFDIKKVGGGYEVKSLDEVAFKTELAKLVNGSYTVTMRIGGELKDGDMYKSLIEQFEKDYDLSVITSEIQISASTNGWKTAPEDLKWTYGDYKEITKPESTHGYATIEFVLSGTTEDGYSVNETFATGIDGTARYVALVNYLKTLGAGNYTLTAGIEGTDTYTALSTTVSVTVSRADNEWISHSAETNVAWTYGDANSLGYEAKYNNDKLVVTVNAAPIDLKTQSLTAYLKAQKAGTYTIIATVVQSGNYKGISETIVLTIAQAQNGWKENCLMSIAESWTWNNADPSIDVKFVAPVPKFGSKVVITVNKKMSGGVTDTVFSVTINYADGVANTNDVNDLKTRLRALGVGEYTIAAVIPADSYYEEFAPAGIGFEVVKAENS